jgi:hypothetical protein
MARNNDTTHRSGQPCHPAHSPRRHFFKHLCLLIVNLSVRAISSDSHMGWKKGQAVQLVPLSQATGRVLDVYKDVQRVFGVPHISSFFQFLGNYPRFLDRFWTAMLPIVQTSTFFSCSQRLRADAYARVRTSFQIPDLKAEVCRQQFSPGACEELKDCINLFCHSVPATLLLSSFLLEAFHAPAGDAAILRTPAPVPKPHRRIVLVEEDSASPAVKAIFADIRRSTGADVVHTVYRAFARWPDFLQSYWTAVKPIAVSERFLNSESALREVALQVTKELPGPVQFTSSDLAGLGMNEDEAGSLTRLTDMFVHSLSAALLNVSVARIAIEGGSLLPISIAEDSAPKTEVSS